MQEVIQVFHPFSTQVFIFTCHEDHNNVFPEVPIIGFKKNKTFAESYSKVDRCKSCGGKRLPC